MKRSPFRLTAAVSLAVGFVVVLNSAGALAQTTSRALPQITQRVSDSQLYELKGHVLPLAQAKYDQGAVPDATPTGRLIMTLKRPVAQENALQKFLAEAHSKGSANYHQWLTPAQFGQQFGPADSDIAAVQSWLQSHGFTVEKIGTGRSVIEYSGTAGQIKEAFHTELHSFNVNGVIHHANASNPKIPVALVPVIAGVGQMSDFHPRSQARSRGGATYDQGTHKLTPSFTVANSTGGNYYAVGPKDLQTQYNFAPAYSAGLTGAGQTVGIVNDSNIDLGLVAAYRKFFQLDGAASTPNLPKVVIDGDDPGVNGDSVEAYLDVEMVAATAPQASVLLYIADGTDYVSGLTLAIQRAVDDDTAPVLNVSFGQCEPEEGADAEIFLNAIWEQAAAQGQTVLVATGDEGSAECDDETSQVADDGLQVNAIADTPWNVAVGGTDFYYSDYATGGASAASKWNAQNDLQYGSLIAPLPEQPWNDGPYGLNSTVQGKQTIVGGSGGQSTCAVEGGPLAGTNVMVSEGYCLADDGNLLGGYPKPSWQAGPGVPNDQVRDVPDVSLFASDGANDSFYVICSTPGDCGTTSPPSNQFHFSVVGGTSAASPAFAGMMALVNQKYGPQGQANYVLYPLAQKVPSVFHDVTVGSNNVPCSIEQDESLGCFDDPDGSGNESLQNWYATSGYDLASGLGSVDVNALLTNWDSLPATTATTTTFTATPVTITHGQSVKLSTTVAASGGKSGIPTGNVVVLANTTLPSNKGQTSIPLDSTGAGTINFGSLPGGTYNLYGRYSGDGTFGSSESSPVSVTVTPESSVLSATLMQDLSPLFPSFPLSSGSTVPYGSQVNLDVQVEGAAGSIDGIATGTITYSDNGTVIATIPVNSYGAGAYLSSTWAPGTHSITASYSGDASYNPSKTTSPLTFTVTQGTTSVSVASLSTGTSISAGSTIPFIVTVAGQQYPGSAFPTGTVTVHLGSLTATGTIAGTNVAGEEMFSEAIVNVPNVGPGTYALSATYGGDANWAGANGTGRKVTVSSSSNGLVPTGINVAITSPADISTIQSATSVTLQAIVTGAAGSTTPPSGMVEFVNDDNVVFGVAQVVPGSGATSIATLSVVAASLFSGNNLVAGLYTGDSTYAQSISSEVSLNNPIGTDFSLLNSTPTVSIASGSPGTANLILNSLGGFSGAVNLTCTVAGGPTGNALLPTCTVPASETVSASGQTAFTVQIATTGTQTASLTKKLGAGGGITLACLFLIVAPLRRRGMKQLIAPMLLFALAIGMVIGCSNNGTSNPPPVPTVPGGTYVAVITGTSTISGTTHNIALNIVVTAK